MSYIHPPKNVQAPVLLRPDNFTPPSRTPWGGTRILERYKPELARPGDDGRVGESWEISVEPDFPAKVEPDGTPLPEVLARDTEGWLGAEAAMGRRSTALLVKLLDAADELSVQIHPTDDYRGLGPGEGGKPESWYVLEHQPGAVLYLGLREGVTREQMRDALRSEGDVAALLHPVQVAPGDFFVIDAGTAHAIGRGITLVEPQHVAPGRRGVTYRYWDWNRRYDPGGRRDPAGEPRALHVEDALAVTTWDGPRGADFVERIRLRAGAPDLAAPPELVALCGPAGGLANAHLAVQRWAGTGEHWLPAADRLRGLTVVDGAVELEGEGFRVRVPRGRSAVLPASLPATRALLEGAHALVCSVA